MFDDLSDTTPTVFADLRTQVHNFWDRGLLGLALDPNFPADPYVYVALHATTPRSAVPRRAGGSPARRRTAARRRPAPTADGCVVSGRVSRLTASGNVTTGASRC